MINNKKILAIIPARGGSKRLPGKNIKKLCGKPLISWTIDAALAAESIDKVVVSTDCKNIAKISLEYGAEVPFLRNKKLSSDNASSIDVVFDVLNYYSQLEMEFDLVILLQPTSPLRDADDIENSISVFNKHDAKSVVSVTLCEHSPLWAGTIPADGCMDGFIRDEISKYRSQDLKQYYRLNGALYLAKVSAIRKYKSFLTNDKSFAFIMGRDKSVDIDNAFDFDFANYILEKKLIKK